MKTNHAPKLPLRVGLFGIGLDTYWQQFARLKESLGRKTNKKSAAIGRDRPRNFAIFAGL